MTDNLKMGVCSDCQQSGILLDDEGLLRYHEIGELPCTGSYTTPETTYIERHPK